MDPDPLSHLSIGLLAILPATADCILAALLLLLIFLNAIISGSEVAFLIAGKKFAEEIHASEKPKRKRVSKLLKKPDKLLAAIVTAYNVLNITIAVLIVHLLNRLPFFEGMTPLNALFLGIIIAVCAILLFVDILPKMYASYRPIRFSEINAPIIRVIYSVMNPFSSLLVKASFAFSRSIMHPKSEITVDDLSKALEITSDETKHEHEKDMLKGIIRFRDRKVDDIFVSRTHIVAIDRLMSFREVIDFIVDAGFSRIPVFEENHDNIMGILYVKDLLPHLNKPEDFQWQSLIRQAYFVPATKPIDDLLEEFRTNKNHMAIVVDEYGGTAGLITMEDILEEIVGDISDEYDEELPLYTVAHDGSYIFEGRTSLVDFIKIANVPEKDFEKIRENVDTIAGLMLELKGDFPKRKETITFKKYAFQAEEMTKKRIVKVRYMPPSEGGGE
jgi:gliding motility-associated protein GldE